MLFAALVFAFVATLCIIIAPGIEALVVSRFCQGVAVGLGMGAGTAFISELLYPDLQASTKAAGLASQFTAFGFGGGALATSLVLLVHFTLVPVTYYLLLGITLLGLLFLFTVPALPPIQGKLLRLPYFPHGSLPVNMAIGICWAATGIIIAIIPAQLSKFGLSAYAGICLALVNWGGALIQPMIRKIDPFKSVRIGLLLVPIGFALVILGCHLGQLLIVCTGTAIVGFAAYGFSYLGGLALVANMGGEQKARAVSGYMFVGYVGFGIPAVCLGYFADHFGIIPALLVFEGAIVLLSGWLRIRFSRSKV